MERWNFERVSFEVDWCIDAFNAAPDVHCDAVGLKTDCPSIRDFGWFDWEGNVDFLLSTGVCTLSSEAAFWENLDACLILGGQKLLVIL